MDRSRRRKTEGDINKAIKAINEAVSNLKGVVTVDNIESILTTIVGKATIDVDGSAGTTTEAIDLGGDRIWTGAADADNEFKALSADDKKAIVEVNALIKAAQDALANFKAASAGENDNRAGATAALTNIRSNLVNNTDLHKVSLASSNTDAIDTGIKTIDNFAALLKTAVQGSSNNGTGTAKDVAELFNSTNGWNAYQVLMQIDTNKLESGQSANDGTTGEQIKYLQKVASTLYNDVAKVYSEGATRVGTAASDLLHVTPNYSRGLGGFEASEIKVNYTAVDVRGLGLQAQSIDSQKGATRALDRLDETLKVISSNRAAIGTYINRLDYTVNNIASMEYNTQDAESRIRDTDFSTETTNFTRNQIMVQSATSMLAQANSLPQAVLGLLG